MPEEFDAYRKWLGIPPEEQPPHHYRLLGIALFENDPDVIQNAADRQMSHVRTFQSGKHARLSAQILNELSAAKVCLLTAAKRAEYDDALRTQLNGVEQVEIVVDTRPPAAPPMPWGGMQATVEPARPSAKPAVEFGSIAPQPVVVGAPSRAGRPAATSRSSRGKSRSMVMPIMLLVLCALVLAGAVAAAMNWNAVQKAFGVRGKPNSDSKSKRDTSQSTPAVEKTEKKPGSKVTSKTTGKGALPEDFSPHGTIPPLPQPLSKAEREAMFIKTTESARRSLEQGKLETAHIQLIEADSFKATEKDQGEVAHLRKLMEYLHAFWNEARQGVYAVEIGKPIDFRKEEITLLKREGESVTYRVGGTDYTGHIRELDTRAAIAFATLAPEAGKTRTRIHIATFLAMTSRGGSKQHEAFLSHARHLWHEAARLGEKDPYLARELGIDPKGEVEPEKEE